MGISSNEQQAALEAALGATGQAGEADDTPGFSYTASFTVLTNNLKTEHDTVVNGIRNIR